MLRMIAGVLFGPGRNLGIFRAVDRGRDVGQPHRRAIAIGDDDVVDIGSASVSWSLASIVEDCARAVKTALGRIDVHIADASCEIVDVEAIGSERARIELNADAGPVAAADADQADARLLRDLLREPGLDEVFESVSGSVFDVIASVRIGASAGLTFA